MRLGRLLAVVAVGLLLAPAVAMAQSSIAGSVTDDTGGVLPGVTIEASSDVLIEGSRVVFTDGTGQYNIIDLRPGEYTVVFTLPGFGTLVRDQLILGADVALPINAVMAVGSVEETITVSGETPVVDVQQVQRIEVMTRETQEAIPTGRSTWSYALLIPGVKARAPDMGGTAGAQQSEMMGRGLDAAHTTVEIDGMMINTLISDGRYQAYMNPMMAAETSYTTSGATAETQTGGLRINMIPNEGGNQYSGNFFVGGTPGQWQGNNLNPRLEDLGVQKTPRVSIIYDFNGSIGGPVFRDKLWFFSSARRNVIDDGVLNSTNRDGSDAIDRNSITSANARLTWQMHPQHKISAMFDKVRKRRFSEHQSNDDIETAAQSWTSPHYDTGTAKWTGTLSNRMLAEFGFSLVYEDWDPGYYRFSSLGDYDYFSQTKPGAGELATCFKTPCYDLPGSPEYMAQTAPGTNWYNLVPRWDAHLGMNYAVADDDEQNNYSHRWAYQGAVSYVTGSHSFKFGTNFSHGGNRHTRTANGDLQQRYDDSPNTYGRMLDFVSASHWAAEANRALGLSPGTTGAAEFVDVKNYPEFRAYNLDFNGGIYAQDSWTIDRLTLNYGLRVDWSSVSIPDTPKGLGRFTPSDIRPGRVSSELPAWGPDFSPRFSMAYDVFGDAKTALKFSWNKYVRDVGTGLPSRYQYGGARTDRREWYDCALDPATLAESPACAAPGSPLALMYASSYRDDVAQHWEIGPQSSEAFGSFGIPSANPVLSNFPREYNHIWTAGIQQEIFPGLSLSGEYPPPVLPQHVQPGQPGRQLLRLRRASRRHSRPRVRRHASHPGGAAVSDDRLVHALRPRPGSPRTGRQRLGAEDGRRLLEHLPWFRVERPGPVGGRRRALRRLVDGGHRSHHHLRVRQHRRGRQLRRRDQPVLGRHGPRGQPQRDAVLRPEGLPAPVPARVQAVGHAAVHAAGPRGHAVRRVAAGVSGRREHPLGRLPGRAQRAPLQR